MYCNGYLRIVIKPAYMKDRPVSVFERNIMSKFAPHRNESPLTFESRKSVVFGASMFLCNVVDVIAAIAFRIYFV